MKVLVACDKWKGSMTSMHVGEVIADGLRDTPLRDADIRVLPLADGGEGSVDAAVAAGFSPRIIDWIGRDGELRQCVTAWRGDLAIVESSTAAEASLGALAASSHDLGIVVRAVIADGAKTVVIGLGGTWSTDGGAGFLQALGAEVRVADVPAAVPLTGADLERVIAVDLDPIDLEGVTLVAASDVDNLLLGAHGAARMYSPQKGAGPRDVLRLERGMAQWVRATRGASTATLPGAGAAGGIGYALLLLGARIESGAKFFLDLLGVSTAMEDSSVVITGEGRLDTQSLHGKAPVTLARRAAPRRVVAVVGRNVLDEHQLGVACIDRVFAIADSHDADRAAADPKYTCQVIRSMTPAIARTCVELGTDTDHEESYR